MLDIKESQFSEYFEKIPDQKAFLLGKTNSESFWASKVDKVAKSYFSLSDDNWIITAQSETICEWVAAYNSTDTKLVSNSLKSSFEWTNKQEIYFCINKLFIIKSSWEIFLNYWDEFIAAEDDCPIILSSDTAEKIALLVTSIGYMKKIKSI